MWCSVVEKLK